MLRALLVLLASATALSAAPLWSGKPGSYRITGAPPPGKEKSITVVGDALHVDAVCDAPKHEYLYFSMYTKPFVLKDKAVKLTAWTTKESLGASFYIYFYNAKDQLVAASYGFRVLGTAPKDIVIVPGEEGVLKPHPNVKIQAPLDSPITRVAFATCKGAKSKLSMRVKSPELIPVPPKPVTLDFKNYGRTVLGGTRRGVIATHDGKGNDTLFIFLMDDLNRRSLQIDPATGKTDIVNTPVTITDAVYASVLSKKNRIYTHYGNYFLEYNPESKKYTYCKKTFPQMAMSITEDHNGVIWSATYPKCGLVSYDPATGKFSDYGSVNNENWAQYPRSIVPGKDGWVYIGVGSTRPQIIAFNTATGKYTALLNGDAERPNPASAAISEYTDGNIYAKVRNQTYQLKDGKKISLAAVPENAKIVYKVQGHQGLLHGKFPSGRVLTWKGIDIPGCRLTTTTADGKEQTVKFENPNDGVGMMGVDVTENGIVGGGSFFPFRFATLDPATGAKTDQDARFQCNTITAHGKYLYLGCYSGGQILRYDPSKPWSWTGNMASKEPSLDTNPAYYGKAHPEVHRPHGLAVSPDGKTVVMAGTPGYGLTGGGLAVVDTETGAMKVYSAKEMGHYPEATFSVAILPGSKAVVGTTISPGTGGETIAKHASLLLVDLKNGKILRRSTVLGTNVLTVINLLTLPNGKVLGVTNTHELFCYDPETDKILAQNSFAEYGAPVGGQGPRSLLTDGKEIYLLLRSGIAVVDPATCKIVRSAKVKGGISVGGGIHKGMLYYSTGTRLRGVQLP
ncbi:MAG: hypothetical protein IKD46_00500 [Lentisphaeria bacterium]|nr:hypothetical protein [Lentisphaeria bacterium]